MKYNITYQKNNKNRIKIKSAPSHEYKRYFFEDKIKQIKNQSSAPSFECF